MQSKNIRALQNKKDGESASYRTLFNWLMGLYVDI